MKKIFPLFVLALTASCSGENAQVTEPKEDKATIELVKEINKTESGKQSGLSSFVLENETVVIEFDTKNEKHLTVCRDKKDKYLVYRFGTNTKVELQYPEKLDESSFKKFDYSSYMRPGGIENLGMNLDYLSFVNNGYRYVVYKTYAAESVGNEDAVGVRIIELKTKKETNIEGDFKTYSGDFPGDIMNRVNQSDELFD